MMQGEKQGLTQDAAKLLVAQRATELVQDGMAVGLGTGTTATMFIRELAKCGRKIRCVASSEASERLGRELGMTVVSLAELPELDLYVDGADEVCVARSGAADAGGAGTGESLGLGSKSGSKSGSSLGLNLIKGGGGAHLREKIVASAARRFVVVVDESKVVERLGRFPLPVEVVKMALPVVQPRLERMGLRPTLRRRRDGGAATSGVGAGGAGAGLFLTDEGNYILDCACGSIAEPERLARELDAMVGVVEHGLFLGMAEMALVAGEGGVRELPA